MNINLSTGILPTGQFPLDAKAYINLLSELNDLGTSDYKAYYYYEGLVVFCVEKQLSYQWREEKEVGENDGVLTNSFTYPIGASANGIDYGGRTFNFFKKLLSESELPEGENDGEEDNGTVRAYYTHLKFGTVTPPNEIPTAGEMSDSQKDMTHTGIAINQLLPESEDPDKDDPDHYIWTLNGAVISYVGQDGLTYYIWVKYSDFADGTNMVDEPGDKAYIGLAYRNLSPIKSENKEDYEWSLILSDIQEQPKVLYNWYKFGDDILGTNMSDSPEGKTHMGVSIDNALPENQDPNSNDPNRYTWNPLTGDQGYIGPDGKTYWIWVKWAMSKTPISADMFDDPDGMTWMGTSVHRTTAVESLDYRDYDWYKTLNNKLVEQNNFLREVPVPSDEMPSLDREGFAAWVNKNPQAVSEDEIVALVIDGDVTIPTPVLDTDIPLLISLGVIDGNSAVINWDANGDLAIVRYELYLKNESTGLVEMFPFTIEQTTTLTGLTPATNYTVYIIAYDTLNNSKTSSFLPFATSFPNVDPIIEVLGVTSSQVLLQFAIDPSFNADRFEVFQVGNAIPIYNGLGPTYEVNGLIPETLYQYYTIAYSGVTASNQSATVDATTLAVVDPPLSAPTISFVKSETTSIQYSISVPIVDQPRVTQYLLEYRLLNQSTWIPSVVPSLNTLQVLLGLVEDKTYELRLKTYDGDVYSDWSNILVVTTLEAISQLGVSINLKIERQFTQQEIDDGYIGQLYIFGGVPNSIVGIGLTDKATFNTYQVPGHLEFQKGDIPDVYSNLTKADLLLDENGEYEDIYKVIVSSTSYGVKSTIQGWIITSANGIMQETDIDTFNTNGDDFEL